MEQGWISSQYPSRENLLSLSEAVHQKRNLVLEGEILPLDTLRLFSIRLLALDEV